MSSKLKMFIAEKSSLRRATADVLSKPHAKDGDVIKWGEHDVVTWCAGHILQRAPPDAYNKKYGK